MDLNAIQQLTNDEMTRVNQTILERLSSDVGLINQLGFYIINSGGKRIRPLVSILAAQSLNYSGDQHITLAAIIEFIHTATLLHDDVVDESELRRGKETANNLFGNAASVLVGDFLYSRAFEMMTDVGSIDVMRLLSSATNVIAEGEVMQLMNCNNPDLDEDNYMEVIYCKTARLFEAASELAAIISEQPAEIRQPMRDYGRYLGTAFQIIDDVMDYNAATADMGKNVGDDLAEGKVTLPLIYAMEGASPEDRKLICDVIRQGDGLEHLSHILKILQTTGALELAHRKAEQEAEKAARALVVLPDSPYKDALIALTHIAIERNH